MTEDRDALWRTLHRVIVVDGGAVYRPRVLVVPSVGDDGGERWGLPAWTVVERREHTHNLERLLAQAREHLGLEVVMLRYLEPVEDEAARERSGTWVLEPRRPGDTVSSVSGARWVTRADLARRAQLAESAPAEGTRAGEWGPVERVLAELEEGVSPTGRCAWSEPGWFGEAEAWMAAQLEALGRPAVGPIEQVKNNSISSVLRAHTAAGDVYLKAASRHFRNEARITQALAERFPAHVPVVLAADVERSWLLLEDFGSLIRRTDVNVWERALCLMGELQRSAAAQAGGADWLLAAGCADRRLAVLREQIPALLDAPETRAEIDAELLARLVARLPELQEACDALAACSVPETLIHGDLHAANVAMKDERLTIFDWTDAALSHSFFDLATFLPTERRKPEGVNDAAVAAQRLREAYLEGWSAVVPMAALRRAAELCGTVARLHHAQSYLQILRSLEPADYWQWEGELARWLTPLVEREPVQAAQGTGSA